ncbi:MAG: ABC transporter ATP-binding protein [Candidatus Dormiibacterota bacterium]
MSTAAEMRPRDGRPEGPLLDVRDLRTYFKTGQGEIRAVDGLSFSVGAAASVGIVGESGSGKSAASLSILRLLEPPGWIAGGEVRYRGRDLLQLPESEMRRIRGSSICMVFQEPMTALNPVYTIGYQVAEVVRAHHGVGKQEARARSLELLRVVGIPAVERRLKDYPHNLSGGMRQRVMIAMALANEPDLLILDEPTTALDVTVQAQILDLVRDLQAKVQTALLLITHDIAVIGEMSEEVVVMYGGKVMERARVGEFMADPKHPYSQGLLSSIPSPRMKGRRLHVIPGSVPNPSQMPPGCPFAPRCPHAMEACAVMPEKTTLAGGREVFCWLY